MNTLIHLTLKEFGNLLHLSPEGNSNKKRLFNPTFFIESRFTFELNIHDRILHLMITWNLRPIKKLAKIRNTYYWWLDSVYFDRHPNLALITFNDITKAIRRAMNTKLTLSYGTYVSPISYAALHHVSYHYDVNFGEWVKSSHPTTNDDDNVEGTFECILVPEHVPPVASFSQAAQPSSEINVTILNALHYLRNDVRGLRDKVRSHKDKVNSQLSTLEMQMASHLLIIYFI
ncbi:hypothetical protein PVK06_048273 [Gossypium arboreum]|uniref:Uncharacterized protein n=1 Tax=Gossypium arboreum TaxID=29729 RepID=A0ABR0MFM6_GOSAR|nr:hypothetical protein PVK06_048273 [Gossypium arboreum]